MPYKSKEKRRENDKKKRTRPECKKMMKKAQHKWYLKNKDAVRKQTKQWVSKNKSKYNKYRREWERENRERSGWKREIKISFNITVEQYYEMFSNQDGCCAICGKGQKELNRRLAIDHCHKTGKIRGLLCFDCNTSLGKWNDDIDMVKKALEYLKYHE